MNALTRKQDGLKAFTPILPPTPVQNAFQGTVDCFLKTQIPDYFFLENGEFQKCGSNCVNCQDYYNCNQCEATDSNGAKIYAVFDTRFGEEVVCRRDCKPEDNRSPLPETSNYDCIECKDQNHYYLDGSNPPKCIDISVEGFKVDSVKRVLLGCKDGLNKKENPFRCENPCTNLNDYLGTDKVTCSSGFLQGEYKDQLARLCTTCSAEDCLDCGNNDVCVGCKPGFYLEGGQCKARLEQCSTCSKGDKCDGCQNNLFLNSDGLTCSAECPKKQYPVAALKECKSCSKDCEECDSKECLVCTEGFERQGFSCSKKGKGEDNLFTIRQH